MSGTEEPQQVKSIFDELSNQSDRAVIVVGGSLLEFALEKVIATRLRKPQTEGEAKMLFTDSEGILGTFSQKIKAAYFLKIVGPQTRGDLDIVRRIRNLAAHNMGSLSFDLTPEIADRCRALQLVPETVAYGPEPVRPRDRFVAVVQFLTANLLMRSGDANAEITEGFAQRAPSLDL